MAKSTVSESIASARHTRGASLRVRHLHLHTQREPIVIMRTDCAVCTSEGLAPRSQVLLRAGGREVTAILFQGADDVLAEGEVGLSEAAWELLGAAEGELVTVSHPRPLHSMGAVRSRIFGTTLESSAFLMAPPQSRAPLADTDAKKESTDRVSGSPRPS